MSDVLELFLLDCTTYEDYLNTFITRRDMKYLRNLRVCRMLVELGYRSATDIYTPTQFAKRKALVQETISPPKKSIILFSDSLTSTDPVICELALRELSNNQKMISTIIFMKHRLKSGFEVSGYIDFEESLRRANTKVEGAIDWMGVFQDRAILRPKPTDLSYYDCRTGQLRYNNSDNFLVSNDVESGLIFMHVGDHKKICVDMSREEYSNNCKRSMFFSKKYGYVIMYDHIIRKKI